MKRVITFDTMQEITENTTLDEHCKIHREGLKYVEEALKELTKHPEILNPAPHQDKGEMIANIILARRHIEDARMRLGKVIQAADGGTSVYPR